MKKSVAVTLWTIACILGFIILLLGYFGFVPILSDITWGTNPRDLGVEYSDKDLASINNKLGILYKNLGATSYPKDSLTIQGSRQIETMFTQEELTALMNDHSARWKYYPVSDAQIRINADGTIEISGRLNTKRITGYEEATDMPEVYREGIDAKLPFIFVRPRYYAKGFFAIEDGVVKQNVNTVEVGRFNVPSQWLARNDPSDFINNRLKEAGIVAKSASFMNGKVVFSGTVPEQVGFGN